MPIVIELCMHCNSPEAHCTVDEVLCVHVENWTRKARLKFHEEGMWSNAEVLRRLNIKDVNDPEYVDESAGKMLCKGMECKFVRMFYLTCKGFFKPVGAAKQANWRAPWFINDAQKSELRSNFSITVRKVV